VSQLCAFRAVIRTRTLQLLLASPGLHWLPRPFPGCSSSQNRLERSSERRPCPPKPEPLPAPLYPAEARAMLGLIHRGH
ncbi:hypothetical protein LEMLEM_LOCUS24784, partial [Lemmus lemmus]